MINNPEKIEDRFKIHDKMNLIKYRVIWEYTSPYPNPTIFRTGDAVKIGAEYQEDPDWKDWFWCEGPENIKAWVPKQFLNIDGGIGTLKRDYNAMELIVSVGEDLLIHEIVNGFGMAEKPDGTRGWVPVRNLELDKSSQ